MIRMIDFDNWMALFPSIDSLQREPQQPPADAPAPPAVKPAAQNDVSSSVLQLSRAGVDFNNSNVVAKASNFQFDLKYQSQQAEQISTSGTYYQQSKSLDFNLHFDYQTASAADSTAQAQAVSFDLSYSVQQFREITIPANDDTNIEEFVSQLKDDFDKDSDEKPVDGKALGLEDAVKISRHDEDEFLKKLVKLARKAFGLAKIKHEHDHDEHEKHDKDHEDKHGDSSSIQQNYSQVVNFSLNISKTAIQITAPSDPAAAADPVTTPASSPTIQPAAPPADTGQAVA